MIYKILTAILETGTWPNDGGLNNQESFWIDLVATFGPLRRSLEFHERFNLVAKSIAGDKKQNSRIPQVRKR